MPAPAKEHAIRERAYYLWERDGRPAGRDLEFWTRAAAELAQLMKRRTPARSAAKPAAPKLPAAEPPKAGKGTVAAAKSTAPAAAKPVRKRKSAAA